MSDPSPGRALFSTVLRPRPRREARDQQLPPVIVRSDARRGVVDAAKFWQNRFRRECLCIFPNCGWQITDLWDPADIHLDTPDHCAQVLQFISYNTFYYARDYAAKWSREHPEALNIVGARDLAAIYDLSDHLAIVDHIFVHGETTEYPREFLWHVAHMIRTTMVEMRKAQKTSTATDNNVDPAPVDQQLPPAATDAASTVKTDAPPAVDGSSAPPNTPVDRAPRPEPPLPVSGAYHGQPMDPNMGGMPGNTVNSPAMSAPTLYNPKSRPPNAGSSSYNRQRPSGARTENMSRVPSGAYASRPPSGTLPSMQSPYFNPASLATGQQFMTSPYPMQPFAQHPHTMSPSMYQAQPYQPGLLPPGMMPPLPLPISNPLMAQGYIQHHPDNRCQRGIPICNTTNNPYFTNYMPPEGVDPRGPANRRNSVYSSTANSLYNPNDAAKPAFNDPNAGKKAARHGRMAQSARQRKSSAPGNRPGLGNYGPGRPDNMPTYSNRQSASVRSKTSVVDDPSITGNIVSGCGLTWIGPENTTVNELFVSDLPDEVVSNDLEHMFLAKVNIRPAKIAIKNGTCGNRKQAFVTFGSPSETQLALNICQLNPQIQRALVKVTVPWRFFKKTDQTTHDYSNHHAPRRPNVGYDRERDSWGASHSGFHVEESAAPEAQTSQPMYSPQDARSDLQKKTSRDSRQPNSASSGSPESRKSKTRKSSPTKKSEVKQEEFIEKETVTEETVKPTEALSTEGASNNEFKDTTATSPKSAGEKPMDTVVEPSEPTEKVTLSCDELSTPLTNTEPTVGEANAATEESSQSRTYETPEISHHDVESQTKANPEPKSAAAAGAFPVVKFPGQTAVASPAKRTPTKNNDESQTKSSPNPKCAEADPSKHADLAPSAEQNVIEDNNAKLEEPIKVEANSQSHEESLSDEEAEVSFQSAQEVAEIESTPVPLTEPMLRNHGTEPATTAKIAEPAIEDSSPHKLAAAQEILPKQSLPARTPAEPEPTAPTSAAASGTDEIQNLGTTTMGGSSTQPVGEVAKKSGPQQTPSLNPFAKPTKAQRQKEKELKKKQMKKEQEDKAAKAKTEKAASSTAPKEPATSVTESKQPQASNAAPTQPDDTPQTTAAVHDATEQAVRLTHGVLSKRKDKSKQLPREDEAKKSTPQQKTILIVDSTIDDVRSEDDEVTEQKASAVGVSDQDKKVGDKKATSGKQTGGTTTQTPEEIGSVTHKAKVTTHLTEEGLLVVSQLLSLVQSPKGGGAHVAEQSADVPPSTVVPLISPVKAVDALASGKTKKSVPTVPNLNLSNNPSTHNKNSQPRLTAAPAASSTATNSRSPQPASKDMSQPAHKPDAASIAGSETTLIPEGTGPPSPSPNAEDFHTPLQTPIDSTAPQNQTVNPKKKKKPKKKKQSAASETTGAAAPAASPLAAPPTVPPGAPPGAPPAATAVDAVVADQSNLTGAVMSDFHSTGRLENDVDHNDPFGGQIRHIDAIRKQVSNPSGYSYYDEVNKELAARDAAREAAAKNETVATEDSNASLENDNTAGEDKNFYWRQIQAYYMESSASRVLTDEEWDHLIMN